MNDERLHEALPLSYLSLLLTEDFHPCPSALLSSIPPSLLFLIVLPQENDRFHLHYLSVLSAPGLKMHLMHAAVKQQQSYQHAPGFLKKNYFAYLVK